MDREAFVYMDFENGPALVGRLWSRVRKGRESATFEYDANWLARNDSFALEPALLLTKGPQHTAADRGMWGAIGDSAPDRWGRVLMRRAEKRRAEKAGTAARTLFEIDYLLAVDDETRSGALRFSEAEGGPFVATVEGKRIPALVELPRLLSAAEHVANDDEDDEDLRLLIAPGSSLGGARPKASVRDGDGHLCIAKFPHKDDFANTVLWEAVALTLAERAGITIPQWRVETVGEKPTLIVRRFDRVGARRIPLLSAMSMLGAVDNEAHSYLEIVEAIQRYGSAAKSDMIELWRRIVLSVLISNFDDHLRNHAFLYEGLKGWRLSPAYDLNPVPIDIKPRILSTAIDPDDPSASLTVAEAAAGYFGIKPPEAKAIISEVAKAVSTWREVAKGLGLSSREVERMASAFEHEESRGGK